MQDFICVIVGGGFAGIHTVKAIQKAYRGRTDGRRLQLILIDKQTYHLRKVLLFRPAVGNEEITVPWQRILPEGSQFVQGTVLKVESRSKRLCYQDAEGKQQLMNYDVLVMAVGSVIRQPDPEQGGIALTGLEAATRILEQWRTNLQFALTEPIEKEKRRLMSVAVAGAGITGIETSAELAYAMREEALTLGLNPSEITIHLLNKNERLFPEGPSKVGIKLERSLMSKGVTVHHRRKALREQGGQLTISGDEPLFVGLVVWTLGLVPNPVLRSMELPLTRDGQVIVDGSYRVRETPGIYCIGDCAHIVDPTTSKADGMTCKEAILQANRLGAIIIADLDGRPAPQHKTVIESFTVGLGPENGLSWTRKWGIDVTITGTLGYKIKSYLWNFSSMLR
ncbi:FAD-dependent oxidoreductase [Paenibacillus sp. N3/727]|uniref:NAD(P)/FAD-dependent oxidoreductase n=1 Tax=Paenibacillus sp. N3/727 TaxID=2925845 RepID=UPI001F530BE7|nr:FAD-dependent oxidoreductase [Paenibacillus sp. N3/727]UNK16368.1 FAD-dependent oxidoreductase [Paenibacillus sp. N3/727]